jgi:hypothetical protein
MPIRAYIVPYTREFMPAPDDQTKGVWEMRAKYIQDMVGLKPTIRGYGAEGVALVVVDVSTLDHGIISGNADVLSFPENLDTSPNTANRNAAITALEARNIPAGWINAGITWRQILRAVAKIIRITKELDGGANFIGRLFDNGRTFSTQFQDLPIGVRQRMIAYATEKGWDTSGLSSTSTLRQILKFLADQLPGNPVLRGVEI